MTAYATHSTCNCIELTSLDVQPQVDFLECKAMSFPNPRPGAPQYELMSDDEEEDSVAAEDSDSGGEFGMDHAALGGGGGGGSDDEDGGGLGDFDLEEEFAADAAESSDELTDSESDVEEDADALLAFQEMEDWELDPPTGAAHRAFFTGMNRTHLNETEVGCADSSGLQAVGCVDRAVRLDRPMPRGAALAALWWSGRSALVGVAPTLASASRAPP